MAAFRAHRGAPMHLLVEALLETGVCPDKVAIFLDADPDGAGSVRDQIAADMTNDLLGALGQHQRQTASDVKRLRQRGRWTVLDQRPRE
jgi:hypothetical protein